MCTLWRCQLVPILYYYQNVNTVPVYNFNAIKRFFLFFISVINYNYDRCPFIYNTVSIFDAIYCNLIL